MKKLIMLLSVAAIAAAPVLTLDAACRGGNCRVIEHVEQVTPCVTVNVHVTQLPVTIATISV